MTLVAVATAGERANRVFCPTAVIPGATAVVYIVLLPSIFFSGCAGRVVQSRPWQVRADRDGQFGHHRCRRDGGERRRFLCLPSRESSALHSRPCHQGARGTCLQVNPMSIYLFCLSFACSGGVSGRYSTRILQGRPIGRCAVGGIRCSDSWFILRDIEEKDR